MIRLNWIGSILTIPQLNLSPVRVIDTMMTWIERSQQRRALARLDERLLADIGVNRSQAEHESNKPGWHA